MSQKGNGGIYKRDRSLYWWCTYSMEGKRVRESTGETDRKKALRYVRDQLQRVDKGIDRRPGAATFADLATGLRGHYRRNDWKSTARMECSLKHLERHLGNVRAKQINTRRIRQYTDKRLEEGAAHASVNRELAALKKALRIAHADGLISDVPAIELLAEHNVRTGFLGDEGYAVLRAELPPHLRPLLDAGYVTGCRKSELLSRRWHHVELERDDDGAVVGGWLRLEPLETKNDEGRPVPLSSYLLSAIGEQVDRKRETERRTGCIVTHVFFYYEGTRAGKPIRDFTGTWKAATKRAGHPGLTFHDLRRTAARNLVRAGVSETVAMQWGGWKTRSVFKRYCIVDEDMLKDAGERLEAFQGDRKEPAERQVVPLEGAGG